MGDRAQIMIKQTGGEIYFYTHWLGYKIKEILKNALIRGKDRWDDESYLSRIIFSQLTKGEENSNTGFGITFNKYPNLDRPLLIVDMGLKKISEEKIKKEKTFEEFIGEKSMFKKNKFIMLEINQALDQKMQVLESFVRNTIFYSEKDNKAEICNCIIRDIWIVKRHIVEELENILRKTELEENNNEIEENNNEKHVGEK